MHSVRSTKSYYVAAFIFGALIAWLIVSPAHSAETPGIDREPTAFYGALQ